METVAIKQQHSDAFAPSTPAKVPLCALNSAVNIDDDTVILSTLTSIECDGGRDGGVSPSIPLATPTTTPTPTPTQSRVRVNASTESDNEVTVIHQKNKKQKVGPDSNKKPGEKRQNKYYWAKIDTPKLHNRTPKTPKVVTSKPAKSKNPKPLQPKTPKVAAPKPRSSNDKKKSVECSKIPEYVQGEPIIDLICKRSLNFEASIPTDLEPSNVPIEVVENFCENTANNTTCTQGLSVGDGDMATIMAKPNIKLKRTITLVYHRRFSSKCLYKCRNLAPKFEDAFKKKRLLRKKMSFGALKRFDGFNRTCLVENLLDRILIVKGKQGKLLPSKVDLSPDICRCVLNVLSSRAKFMKKKRLPRARRALKQRVNLDESIPITELLKDESNGENISIGHPSFNSLVSLPPLNGPAESCQGNQTNVIKEKNSRHTYRKKGKQEDKSSKLSENDEPRESGPQSVIPTPSTLKGPAERCQGSKTNLLKEKKLRRTYKKKAKQEDNLSKLSGMLTSVGPLKDDSNEQHIFIGQESFNSDIVLFRKDEQSLRESDAQNVTPTPSTAKGLAERCKGRNTNVVKEKNSTRTFKKNGNQEDYLSKFSDWNAASVEKIRLQFGSLKLNDDPKTWEIVINDHNYKTDDLYEKMKFEEERVNLFKKIGKFLQEMYYYQGSKKFIKWNGSVLDSVVGVFLTQNVSDILSSNAYMSMASKYPIKPPTDSDTGLNDNDLEVASSQESSERVNNSPKFIVEYPDDEDEFTPDHKSTSDDKTNPDLIDEMKEYDDAVREMLALLPDLQESKKKGKQAEGMDKIDWEKIRVQFASQKSLRTHENRDSVDWEAVRKAPVLDIAKVIQKRGQQRIIAAKIQKTLNRLVEDHGSLDMEWLRDAPPQVAKAYLLSFYGLGLKSVECLRLLTLHHHGFPVDVNISRISIRLGWVPIMPLPPGMPFHLLQKYPLEDAIQQYLWPRLSHLKQETLYHLHYQMITFGKVFCQKRSPNCRACPFKSDCKYYASLSESHRLALPGPTDQKTKKSKKHGKIPNPFDRIIRRPSGSLPCLKSSINSCSEIYVSPSKFGSSSQLSTTSDNVSQNPEYFVEVPSSPKLENVEERLRNANEVDLVDIEDLGGGHMYHLKLNNTSVNNSSLLNYCEESDMSSQNSAAREMVSVSPADAFNPLPKQVNVARLRTEHQVYELPRDNPLLNHLKLEKQLGDVPYLLAVWTPGQTEKNSGNTEERPCSGVDGECTSLEDFTTIPGTLLLPVQTALRRSFPLNGTYFQMNEVFVDKKTSKRPFNVPTNLIWNLKKRTLYCGTSTSSIVKGTTEMEIRQCFREGFVCTRGFSRRTRGPKPLPIKFHNRPNGKSQEDSDDSEDSEDKE